MNIGEYSRRYSRRLRRLIVKYIPHKELCLCCFLTVPYKRHFSKFLMLWFLTSTKTEVFFLYFFLYFCCVLSFAPRGFSLAGYSGFPPPSSKTNISNFQFDQEHREKNGFPFLDILGYLKNTHKNPKFGRVRQVPIWELSWEFPDWDLSHDVLPQNTELFIYINTVMLR